MLFTRKVNRNLHYMTCIFVLNKTKTEIFVIAVPALQNSKYLLIGGSPGF